MATRTRGTGARRGLEGGATATGGGGRTASGPARLPPDDAKLSDEAHVGGHVATARDTNRVHRRLRRVRHRDARGGGGGGMRHRVLVREGAEGVQGLARCATEAPPAARAPRELLRRGAVRGPRGRPTATRRPRGLWTPRPNPLRTAGPTSAPPPAHGGARARRPPSRVPRTEGGGGGGGRTGTRQTGSAAPVPSPSDRPGPPSPRPPPHALLPPAAKASASQQNPRGLTGPDRLVAGPPEQSRALRRVLGRSVRMATPARRTRCRGGGGRLVLRVSRRGCPSRPQSAGPQPRGRAALSLSSPRPQCPHFRNHRRFSFSEYMQEACRPHTCAHATCVPEPRAIGGGGAWGRSPGALVDPRGSRRPGWGTRGGEAKPSAVAAPPGGWRCQPTSRRSRRSTKTAAPGPRVCLSIGAPPL